MLANARSRFASIQLSLAAAPILAAGLTQPAHAEPVVSEQVVVYSDLDLSQENDAREMLSRLRWAAFRAPLRTHEITSVRLSMSNSAPETGRSRPRQTSSARPSSISS